MNFRECVYYDFCGHVIKVIMTDDDLNFGDYTMIKCGYTGYEHHYIFLGEY